MWLKALQAHFRERKRSQHEADATCQHHQQQQPHHPAFSGDELVPPTSAAAAEDSDGEEEDAYESHPKRRSVSMDVCRGPGGSSSSSFVRRTAGGGGNSSTATSSARGAASVDLASLRATPPPGAHCEAAQQRHRPPSLDQWHEARRARNSLEGQLGTTTTDRLTVCKAGHTTIVNKTYITIKHLGSGTFGRVTLAYNVYEQRLYAIKACRKSQFAASVTRSSRLRRGGGGGGMHSSSYGSLQHSPGGSSGCVTARSCGGGFGASALLPPLAAGSTSSSTVSTLACNNTAGCSAPAAAGVTNICATSGLAAAAAAAANAAAAASLFGSSSGGNAAHGFGARVSSAPTWGAAPTPALPPLGFAFGQQQQHQQQHPGLPRPPSPPSPPKFHAAVPSGRQAGSPLVQQAAGLVRQQSLPAAAGGGGRGGSSSPMLLGSADGHLQRGHHHSSCTQLPVAAGGPPPLLSSGGAGGCITLLGTDGSSGSGLGGGGLGGPGCGGGGSVFADALQRFATEELVREVAVLKKLAHPNIVRLVEVIDDPGTDSLLLVMEYVEGGTLQPRQLAPGRWEPLPESEVWRYVREVLQGLDYLHHHKVVHSDLKPSNLLRDSNSGKVKIADFGSSSIIDGGAARGLGLGARGCGGGGGPGFSTPAFRSPESLTSGYSPSAEMDVWALGVCVYMWVYGVLPFSAPAPFLMYERIRGNEATQPANADVSPELRDFISRLLDRNVLTRPDVQGAMQHPWVTLSGSTPLPSIRQQQAAAAAAAAAHDPATSALQGVLEATQEEVDAAIQQLASGGISELMDVVFEERQLAPGQRLVSPGDAADSIFLIAAGELEILSPPAAGASPGAAPDHSGPLISGLDLAQLAEQADPDVWDAAAVDNIPQAAGGDTDIMLLSDVLAPLASSGGGGSPPSGLRLLAVKGPGDSLGLPQLPHDTDASKQGAAGSPAHAVVAPAAAAAASGPGSVGAGKLPCAWRVVVRARGPAVVFVARLADLARLVDAHPEMRGAVQQIVTQQETDMMVAEAMRQLRLYNDTQTACCHHQRGASTSNSSGQAAGDVAAAAAAPHDGCSDMVVDVSS